MPRRFRVLVPIHQGHLASGGRDERTGPPAGRGHQQALADPDGDGLRGQLTVRVDPEEAARKAEDRPGHCCRR